MRSLSQAGLMLAFVTCAGLLVTSAHAQSPVANTTATAPLAGPLKGEKPGNELLISASSQYSSSNLNTGDQIPFKVVQDMFIGKLKIPADQLVIARVVDARRGGVPF